MNQIERDFGDPGLLANARDMHEAVGLWWGQQLVMSQMTRRDNGDLSGGFAEAFVDRSVDRNLLLANVPVFSQAIEAISRGRELNRNDPDFDGPVGVPGEFAVNYYPDPELVKAAEHTENEDVIIGALPWKTRTVKEHFGDVVRARRGYSGDWEQIWPPQQASRLMRAGRKLVDLFLGR